MAINNDFRFIGICYRDAIKIPQARDTKTYYTEFTLVIGSNLTKGRKNNYITIRAVGELAERASIICRNGNKVAVVGEVVTTEYIDRTTAEMKVRITFIANDIMIISKPIRYMVGSTKYTRVVELASINEYTPPERKQSNGKVNRNNDLQRNAGRKSKT